MQQFLTDDEIVALSSAAKQLWPFPLVTIRIDSNEAVKAAGFRGLRSLLVRGLAVQQKEGLSFEPELVGAFETIGQADRMVFAHMSSVDHLGVEGAAALAFLHGSRLLLDSVTTLGVHALGDVGPEDAKQVLRNFAYASFTSTDPSAAIACVILADSDAKAILRIRPGSVEAGTASADRDRSVFVPTDQARGDFSIVEAYLNNAF